jgi:hypothetical protein
VTLDHESIDELLAGYVLRSLSGTDAAEADRLLSEHVPGCMVCHEALAGFQAVTADLALAASPLTPPDTLLPRLHRQLESVDRRRRPVQLFAAAATVVAVVGLAGLAATQGAHANRSRARIADMSAALTEASRPDASITQVGPTKEITAPGSTVVYLYGAGVPVPPSGHVYRIWLVAFDGTATFLGELPIEEGVAFARLVFDPQRVKEIRITVEPSDSAPNHPGEVAWTPAA